MPAASHPLRVLIADDCKDAAQSLEILLCLWGHEVRMAHDGLTALQVADSYQPHVILLDIAMPRMNGYEVARRLRQTPGMESVRLVAVSGYGQERDVRRAWEAGFDHHLLKPYDPEQLRRLLESVAVPGRAP